jgi:hypothetical protein
MACSDSTRNAWLVDELADLGLRLDARIAAVQNQLETALDGATAGSASASALAALARGSRSSDRPRETERLLEAI